MSQLCDCLAEIPRAATAACERQISVSESRSEPPVPGGRARLGATFVSACHKFFFFFPFCQLMTLMYMCVWYMHTYTLHICMHTHNISIKALEFRQVHKHFRTVSLHIPDLCRRI